MTGSYGDKKSAEAAMIATLFRNLEAYQSEEIAKIDALNHACAIKTNALAENYETYEISLMMDETDDIIKQYDKKIHLHEKNIEKIQKLQNILLYHPKSTKLADFYEVLNKQFDKATQKRILRATKAPFSSIFSSGMFVKKVVVKKSTLENVVAALLTQATKYIQYLEEQKIAETTVNYRIKYQKAAEKNHLRTTESKEMSKLTTDYHKKIAQYKKEIEKIESFRAILKGTASPAEKLQQFQTAFTAWKEQDMKWRMFRSQSSRGKGLFSVNVKKIFSDYTKKTKPPSPSRFSFRRKKT